MNERSLEENIKRSRVFILGAGFSAEAGIPLTSSLLENSMKKFKEESPGLFDRVDRYAHECENILEGDVNYSTVEFSKLCTFLEYVELREYGGGERWNNAGSKEKLALRFYLAKTIAENTPSLEDLPPLYEKFATQLNKGDVIISFNWDGLLEIALTKLGKPYTYNINENIDDDAITLRKLHGSINWRLDTTNNLENQPSELNWESMGFTNGMMDTEIYCSRALLNYKNWMISQPFSKVQPFLVLPGYGKGFDVRFVAPLWYKIEWAFAFTHDVYIIGLSLTPDDFFIRSWFLSNLPYLDSYTDIGDRQIYVINCDPEIERNYNFTLSKGKINFLKEPFSDEHIDLIQDRLKINSRITDK